MRRRSTSRSTTVELLSFQEKSLQERVGGEERGWKRFRPRNGRKERGKRRKRENRDENKKKEKKKQRTMEFVSVQLPTGDTIGASS